MYEYTLQKQADLTWNVLVYNTETQLFEEPETGFATKSDARAWVLNQRFPETAGRRAKPTA